MAQGRDVRLFLYNRIYKSSFSLIYDVPRNPKPEEFTVYRTKFSHRYYISYVQKLMRISETSLKTLSWRDFQTLILNNYTKSSRPTNVYPKQRHTIIILTRVFAKARWHQSEKIVQCYKFLDNYRSLMLW